MWRNRCPSTNPDVGWLRKQFKNPRSFFEEGGKDRLREQAERQIMSAVSDYAEQHVEKLAKHYVSRWERRLAGQREYLARMLDGHVEGMIRSLSESSAEDLPEKLDELSMCL